MKLLKTVIVLGVLTGVASVIGSQKAYKHIQRRKTESVDLKKE